MPYDPRQMQAISRMGLGMMAPQPLPFQQPQQRPPEWWEQPLPQRRNQPADQSADPSQDPDAPKAPPRQPPSLLDMMMSLGRMTPAEHAKAQSRQPPGQPQDPGMTSPWGWLGGLGGGEQRR